MNSRFKTYQDVESYLNQLPMFGKSPSTAIRFALEPMLKFLEAMGNPHMDFRSIHVAGTNGKGTVCRLLASIYQQAGYKTGLYTSPHLTDFRDRFKIDGERMNKETLLAFFQEFEELIDQEPLTYFELSTVISFWYFSRQEIDLAIIEVGLGGRLDATNVITPVVSVITSVGLDHTDLLGSTVEQIASEKGGIIKRGVPVVTGKLQPDAAAVVKDIAAQNATVVIECDEKELILEKEEIGFRTAYQKEFRFPSEPWKTVDACNFKIVWEVTTLLQDRFPVGESRFQEGIIEMNRRFRNRAVFERVSTTENWYFDGAHNPAAVTELINKLLSIAEAHEWKVVLSFMKDKLTPEIAELWSPFPEVYLFDMNTQRAATNSEMAELFPHAKPFVEDSQPGFTHLKSSLVIFSGSFYFYSTVIDWMGTSPE